MAFFYPKIYAFFCYYRKGERRKEFEEKVAYYYQKEKGSHQVKEIVKGVFELRGVRKVMRYLIPLMDEPYIRRFVKVEGLHYLDGALKEGRGVLLMAGHIGIPHLAFNALRVMGYDLILLSGVTPKIQKHPRIRYYDTHENTIFVNDYSLSEEYKERILGTLGSGRIIYYDGDAGEGKRKEKVPFLRKEMDFPTGMIHLALQAKAAIIPFIHLYRNGKTHLIFKEAIDGFGRKKEEGYRQILMEFTKRLESYILLYPEQYMGIYGPTVLAYDDRSRRNG